MEKKISSKEAYLAAFEFLGDIYDQHEQDDLGVLLAGMELNSEGESMDDAMKSIWQEIVETKFSNQLDFDNYESFELMLLFLGNVNTTMHSNFLNELLIRLREEMLSETIFPDWKMAIDKIIYKFR